MNDISDRTRRDPANFLAIGRTIMANERTLLAFLRTSPAFFLVGVGLIKFLNHPVLDVISVGAAFQPRLNDYGVRVTYFRGWKATPTKSWC
jgi:uncharacterized membrane protein YidH (DUF202 family)